MSFQPDVDERGAVRLAPDVVCDGFVFPCAHRVQSHVHTDHMDAFDTSKGTQIVLMTRESRALLIAEQNADLPFRNNVLGLSYGEAVALEGASLTLLPAGHMLGAAQVRLELDSGRSIGYSGDFGWPLDEVIEVETLIVDSTYGSPRSVRNFSQAQVEDQLSELVRRLAREGPVFIIAHRGTLQRALQVVSGAVDVPLLVGPETHKEAGVYREYGYVFGEEVLSSSLLGRNIIKHEESYVRFYGRGDGRPVDLCGGSQIKLSAYFTTPDTPVTEYSPRAYGVAMSNHADFYGTLEYVAATGATEVIVDNTRGGHGVELAWELERRLGIRARPSSNTPSLGWGGGRSGGV